MTSSFPWTCPYCNRDATITGSNYDIELNEFNSGNKLGLLALRTSFTVCPNPTCREFVLEAELYKGVRSAQGFGRQGPVLFSWRLKPNSSAKPLPDYIPAPIVDDYNEACLIRDLSPKASATLSRRCLQGMIRDFWKIKKDTLFLEVNALKDHVDASTWEAIDAVRKIGNIGAHMEKDIDVIVDVEPEEAQLLIGLIEMLIKDWYVAKHEREERMKALVATAAAKKNPPATPP